MCIPILSICNNGEESVIKIFLKDSVRLCECEVMLTLKKEIGIPVILKRYRHRIGFWIGILLFFATVYVSPMFLWKIDISGNESVNDSEILKSLESAGVAVGSFSPLIKRSEVYHTLLTSNEDLAWISVNVIGSTANVEVVEREFDRSTSITFDYSNIVAEKAGRIIDMNVTKGRRTVKDGEVVSKGQILVSGVYDTAKMGTVYSESEAEVLAAVSDSFKAYIPLVSSEKRYAEAETECIYIKLFRKSINILKNYSQTTEKYDTIIREDCIPLKGFDRLPLTVVRKEIFPYDIIEITLTESEALRIAQNEVRQKIMDENYSDLLGFEESYYVADGVLYYTCSVDAIQNIATVSEIKIN